MIRSLDTRLRADRALFAVSALALANAVADSALLPVLPTLQERFGLSGAQTGALLSAATIVTLAASVPIGRSPAGSDPASCF